MAKTLTKWRKNPASEANQYLYNDALVVYNSDKTYNGLVSGEPTASNKKPATWTKRAA